MQPLAKNDQVEIAITAVSSEGAGVGRVDGMAVFVPSTAVGDLAQVRIVKVTKHYAVGRLTALLSPSPHRIAPDCEAFPRCGGCVYRHITYAEECRVKQARVADALRRIGGIALEPEPILASKAIDGYRNKAQFPVGRSRDGQTLIGFYAPRSHRIVDSRQCRLQPAAFDQALAAFAGWMEDCGIEPYEEETGRGLVRRFYLRCAPATGQIMACVVTTSQALPHAGELCARLRDRVPGLRGVLQNIHPDRTNLVLGRRFVTLWGEDAIEDLLCGLRIRISLLSFYQVNSPQAERLYRKAAELAQLRPDDILLDLYCGTGAIGLSMASRVSRVVGVEVVPDAVEDAKRNAQINGISNAEFLCMDASQAADQLAANGMHPDVVVLDPPRKGCSDELVEVVARSMAPQRVVYISCDPATLARDLAAFVRLGYEPCRAVPVDLFPRTAHVETVVRLSRETNPPMIQVKMEVETGEVKEHPTYKRIQEYVQEKYGFKVHTAYIAEVKRMCGLDMHKAPNAVEQRKHEYHPCPPEKVKAIKDALRHFGLITD